jgi:hypothetical protein
MHAMTMSKANDFDFLFGRWTVRHRRLKERLAGCTEWQTFGGTSSVMPLLGGHGNVDDNVIELPAGRYRAATLRAFDAARGLWSIWWLDGRWPDRIDVPMVGGFDAAGGEGSFFADETFNGRPIKVRFLWSHIGPSHCRWAQAFSPDGGQSWETNWQMAFDRAG